MRVPRTKRKGRPMATNGAAAISSSAAAITPQAPLTAEALASRLNEPNVALLAQVLEALGHARTDALLQATLALEGAGGIPRKHPPRRRRTPGGAFFWLVRATSTQKARTQIFPAPPAAAAATQEVSA